jgi:aflatoxin B1 aldehyde reductase
MLNTDQGFYTDCSTAVIIYYIRDVISTMASTLALPRLYFGTMTFGWSNSSKVINEHTALEMLKLVQSKGVNHFDSARIYAGGKTETILGQCFGQLAQDSSGFRNSSIITTKVHPSQSQGLSPAGLRDQLNTSLQEMGLTYVDELYLHQPDTENALSDSLEAADLCVKEGLAKRIGMSNYHEVEVQRAMQLCKEHNWTRPSIYQGLYNPLNRRVEKSLLPVLREHQIEFVAYNALAAGLLTGKHQQQQAAEDALPGRFKNNENYLPRFYTDANFRAIEIIQAALPEGLDLITATYIWLRRHSALLPTDGILLGASSMTQLEGNLAACEAAVHCDPLPEPLLAAFERAWEVSEGGTEGGPGPFPYWRGYSLDQPGRDLLDPGASYSAVKK